MNAPATLAGRSGKPYNHDPVPQGYGFVEFSHPASALACKQAMDEIERNMRPDPRKPKEKASAQDKAAGSVSDRYVSRTLAGLA